MKTFEQWLSEQGKRTGLGIYPSLYYTGQVTPLGTAAANAGHLNAYAYIHGDEQPELVNPEIRKICKKTKKKQKKQKNVWAKSFGYMK
jgi:hypothetical protein